jgi:hypothetical protein
VSPRSPWCRSCQGDIRKVTKGSPSAGRVQWLGDVPEHWEVKPLKCFVPQVTVIDQLDEVVAVSYRSSYDWWEIDSGIGGRLRTRGYQRSAQIEAELRRDDRRGGGQRR